MTDELQRGVVQSYNTQACAGLIQPVNSLSPLKFKDPRHAVGVRLFDPGDVVTFQIIRGEVSNIQIIRPAVVHKDVMRCPTCRRYWRYFEVEERITDGDWGEGLEHFCKTCGKVILSSGSFTDAFAEYLKGKMVEPERSEFEQALANRHGLNDFLKRKYPHT